MVRLFFTLYALISRIRPLIGLLHDPVTWYGLNYAGTQITHLDFQNKGTRTSPATFLCLKVPLRYLRPSIIYSVPCDRIVCRSQRLRQVIDPQKKTEKSRYFAITEFNTCFVIQFLQRPRIILYLFFGRSLI